MVGFLWMVLVGAVVGWLASIVMRRDSEQGWIGNIIVGIVGALIGGWIGRTFFGVDSSLAFDLPGFLVSLIGAVVLCGALNYFQRGTIR